MQNLINNPLDTKSLYAKLALRFSADSICKMSEIPLPESLNNLTAIAQKIHQSIKSQKKIAVVGDYDVDGIVACAILSDFFKQIDYPVIFEIPNRFSDGYGLSPKIIERLECEVIITVDNGINAIESADLCKEKGIELLITDHHTPQAILPNALICNPKLSPNFPEPEICGACVAWYLCGALKKEMRLDLDMTKFLDLLALAIISDVMPLVGLNRLLFKKGLSIFKTTQRASLKVLKEYFSKYELNSQTLSYSFIPLLNCAGRIRDAKEAFEFLIQEDNKEALERLEGLLLLNKKRKTLQHSLYLQAKSDFYAQNMPDIPFILVKGEWNEGIVGISAAKLCEEFKKPAIILAQKGELLKGSLRTPAGLDCVAILEHSKEYLEAFGGHFRAAGLSLRGENFENFRAKLMSFDYASTSQESFEESPSEQSLLGYLPLNQIDLELWKVICEFEPFGNANPLPRFYTQGRVKEVSYFGDGHSKIVLEGQGRLRNALAFFQVLPKELCAKDLGCIFTLQWNQYNSSVEMKLESYEILNQSL